MTLRNYKELRNHWKTKMPEEWKGRDPIVGLLATGAFCLYVAIFVFTQDNVWALPLAAIMLGFIAEFLSMANHDILHGSVFKSKNFSVLFCIPISTITLISPSFWKFWHNFHHQSVDRWTTKERPYEMGYETQGYPKLRKWLGPVELFFYKAFHINKTQIRFLMDKRYKSQNHKDLKLATGIQYFIIIATKSALFIYLPFRHWIFLELLPLLIQNFLSSMFLVTQHSEKLDNGHTIRTFSVSLPRWLEIYSLNLGYHVEHHLFPNVASKHLPEIRKIMREEFSSFPQETLSMQEAITKIYKN